MLQALSAVMPQAFLWPFCPYVPEAGPGDRVIKMLQVQGTTTVKPQNDKILGGNGETTTNK